MTHKPRRIVHSWPGLRDWEKHSFPTDSYNCIAFAAGDLWTWWDHYNYWPPGAHRGERLAHLVSAFVAVGFQNCGQDDSLEIGFEKVSVYQTAVGIWTHAARLRPDGWWESKMGHWEDILHKTPYEIEGTEYGKVGCFLKRTIADSVRARIEARTRAKANQLW